MKIFNEGHYRTISPAEKRRFDKAWNDTLKLFKVKKQKNYYVRCDSSSQSVVKGVRNGKEKKKKRITIE